MHALKTFFGTGKSFSGERNIGREILGEKSGGTVRGERSGESGVGTAIGGNC